ncbi:MAG: protease modulator HflC [Spirochaetales bacterium]|nr:protease modulator HflC [Spirochaetales bacterium]
MKKLVIALAAIVALVVAFLAIGPFFVLYEGQQAVVVRLGQIVATHTEAGLKFKSPFVDNVVVYSKKILPWDGEPQRIPTKENQFIFVDMTARWRIADPIKFYESVTTINDAYGRLDDVIDSAVRTIISKNFLREAVRNSNVIMESTNVETFETGDAADSDSLRQLTQTESTFELIEKGRERLSNDMLAEVGRLVPEYGIEVIDVVPRQIKYSEELTESVYSRMIKERNQIAQAFRSLGEGKKAEWLGKLENEQRTILSGAYEKAETLKGAADAEATAIYARSYGRDPAFYSFWRALESYKQTMPSFSKTISTELDYFKFLYGPSGR